MAHSSDFMCDLLLPSNVIKFSLIEWNWGSGVDALSAGALCNILILPYNL